MAFILNIETSQSICSVSLSENGIEVELQQLDLPNSHSAKLASMVDEILKKHETSNKKIRAIGVSIGPGSYTGLRIGLSFAKGLAYGRNIPIIAIPTLKIMAQNFLLKNDEIPENALLYPMMDARRMEVYTATFNKNLDELKPSHPYILDENSNALFKDTHPHYIFGSGALKCETILKSQNIIIDTDLYLTSKGMGMLSDKDYINNDLSDTAYLSPLYLKEFEALHSKKDVLGRGTQFDK